MEQKIINFNTFKLTAIIDEDGTAWIAVKPIIDAIGLHADSAVLGIKNDEILGAIHGIRHGLDAANRSFPMVCLPIHHVHGWLFKIETAKVKTFYSCLSANVSLHFMSISWVHQEMW
jgi:hypothetical protein